MARILHEKYGYPVKEVCQALGLARSSYYYQERPEMKASWWPM